MPPTSPDAAGNEPADDVEQEPALPTDAGADDRSEAEQEATEFGGE